MQGVVESRLTVVRGQDKAVFLMSGKNGVDPGATRGEGGGIDPVAAEVASSALAGGVPVENLLVLDVAPAFA